MGGCSKHFQNTCGILSEHGLPFQWERFGTILARLKDPYKGQSGIYGTRFDFQSQWKKSTSEQKRKDLGSINQVP